MITEETAGQLYDRLPVDGTPVDIGTYGGYAWRAWRSAPVPPGPCHCPNPDHNHDPGEDGSTQ